MTAKSAKVKTVYALAFNSRESYPLFLNFLIMFVLSSGVLASETHEYHVSIDESLSFISVKACFSGQQTFDLYAESLDASMALVGAATCKSKKALNVSGKINIGSVPAGDCLCYVVDVSRPIMAHDKSEFNIERVGSDLIVAEGIWLWRPKNIPENQKIKVSFDLPTGYTVSVPWRSIPDYAPPSFYLTSAPFDWPAFFAFGTFQEKVIREGKSRIRISILESKRKNEFHVEVYEGIARAVRFVAEVLTYFPAEDLQVVVRPGAYGLSPVALGYVSRGGKPSVHFHINERRVKKIKEDTTLIHEFAHLLLPSVTEEDTWLSEGLATYYEYILAGRNGILSADEVLNLFSKKFLIAKSTYSDKSLREVKVFPSRRSYQDKVYWGGAAIIFVADAKLRIARDNLYSMDKLLIDFKKCCAHRKTVWSGKEIFDEFDRLSQTRIFSILYRDFVDLANFADVGSAFYSLGYETNKFAKKIQHETTYPRVRDAIFKGFK